MDTDRKDQLVATEAEETGMDHAWIENYIQILHQYIIVVNGKN